jgi:hypothetical protein
MSRTDEFISSLADFELAFLKKYKLKTYLKPTQEKVKREIERRRLFNRELDRLIEQRENNPKNMGCPRCDSNKIATEKIEMTNGSSGGGGAQIAFVGAAVASGHDLSSKGTRVICYVCGYVLKDDNKKESIFRKFSIKLREWLNNLFHS